MNPTVISSNNLNKPFFEVNYYFIEACKNNDLDKVKQLWNTNKLILLNLFDINYKANTSSHRYAVIINDPIDIAIQYKNLEIVNHLLNDSELKKTLNNDHYIKYFETACWLESISIVNYLLFSSHERFIERYNLGINMSAKNGQCNLLKYFRELNNHEKFELDIRKENINILSQACENGHQDIVRYIFSEPKIENFTPLIEELEKFFKQAFVNDSLELVKFFIFELNIPFTDYIKSDLEFYYGGIYSDIKEKDKIENLFSIRELQCSLIQELNVNNENEFTNKKIKL